MDIQSMVVLCVTILGGVMSICFAIVMVSHRRRARSWARAFRDGAGIRIVGALAVVFAAIYLAAAGLLTEPLVALLSAMVGFILGGAIPAARATNRKARECRDKRGRRPPRKVP